MKSLICTILLAAISFSAISQETTKTARLGFGAAVPDNEVMRFINKNSARSNALLFWSYGISGTHRAYVASVPQRHITTDGARVEIAETLQRSVKGNNVRLYRFYQAYSESEVAASTELQDQLRSLLTLRAQIENALLTVTDKEHPIFYGLEIEGDAESVSKAMSEGRVKASVVSDRSSGRLKAASTVSVKPQAFNVQYVDSVIQTENITSLYERLEKVVSDPKNVLDPNLSEINTEMN